MARISFLSGLTSWRKDNKTKAIQRRQQQREDKQFPRGKYLNYFYIKGVTYETRENF